jgi:hypothetical protein
VGEALMRATQFLARDGPSSAAATHAATSNAMAAVMHSNTAVADHLSKTAARRSVRIVAGV